MYIAPESVTLAHVSGRRVIAIGPTNMSPLISALKKPLKKLYFFIDLLYIKETKKRRVIHIKKGSMFCSLAVYSRRQNLWSPPPAIFVFEESPDGPAHAPPSEPSEHRNPPSLSDFPHPIFVHLPPFAEPTCL